MASFGKQNQLVSNSKDLKQKVHDLENQDAN
jgi:hypothetical protein